MKKKIFVGLFASVLVCLAFVFTNASTTTYSVSGTVTVLDENSDMLNGPVHIDITRGTQLVNSQECNTGERFDIKVRCSDVVSFSYSDSEGSADWNTNYCSNSSNEQVTLHYSSHSSASN